MHVLKTNKMTTHTPHTPTPTHTQHTHTHTHTKNFN